jgi:hypothetical protein
MNPHQARARVAGTFPQSFNKTKFLEFTRNLLNKFGVESRLTPARLFSYNSRNETLTPALSRPTGEGKSSPAQMQSDGRRSKVVRMADNAPQAVPSPGGEGQGEGSPSLVPRADLETFVHLGDQISHY